MAESTLSVSCAVLRKAVGRYYGYGNDPTFSSLATDDQANITATIEQGLRWAYVPAALGEKYNHSWSFLRPTTTLTTSAPYETGTVTIVAGVVTLASGTFPSWAADGELIVAGATYTVASRDGDTQITLDDTSVAASAGTAYQLVRPYVTMPDDFGGLITPLYWQPGQLEWTPLCQTSPEQILAARVLGDDAVNPPRQFAIRPKTFTAATGQRFEAMFEPVPSDAHIFTYRYRARPNTLGDSDYPYGGMEHGEMFLAACLAAAELRKLEQRGHLHEQFLERLSASIALDRQIQSPDYLGAASADDVYDWPDTRSGGGYSVPTGYSLGD